MRYKTRRTIHGDEYWDTRLNKTILVSRGQQPDFTVSEPPLHYGDAKKRDALEDELAPKTVADLTAYATKHKIEIPKDVTKKQDIIDWICDHG